MHQKQGRTPMRAQSFLIITTLIVILLWGVSSGCGKPCPAVCSDGETQCSGTQVQTCHRGEDSCFNWSAPSSCGAASYCSGSACVACGAANSCSTAGSTR